MGRPTRCPLAKVGIACVHCRRCASRSPAPQRDRRVIAGTESDVFGGYPHAYIMRFRDSPAICGLPHSDGAPRVRGCELAHDRRACTSEVVVLLLIVLCPCCAQTPDLLTPTRFAARRLLGQGYAAGEARSIFGRSDDYRFSRSGRAFTTEAQAEGAIEGDALDYRVASPFATDWRFSRFSAFVAAPRSASKIVSEHDRPLPRDVSQMNFQGADIGSVPAQAPSPSAVWHA